MRADNAGTQLQYSDYASDGRLVWQRDEAAGKRINNVYLAGSLVAEVSRSLTTDAATYRYVHTDALGSPIAKTSSTGAVIETSEYEPYGQLLNRANDDRAGYTGHVMDAASGLIYMQARYYDPGIGGFLSVDPVSATSVGGNFNRYWYANNNPYRFKDPDGRKCTTTDGKDACTFDEFKDRHENTIAREAALGGRLSQIFGRGAQILRAEAAMTAKYTAARGLAARGEDVTIKGNSSLGIPDQTVSGAAIVGQMETIALISYAGASSKDVAPTASTPGVRYNGGVPPTSDGSPSNGPIRIWRNGEGTDVARLFGHEILHTIYDGSGLSNRGWANPDFNYNHQRSFDEASDAIH